jgi:hypothetical protein
MSGTLRTQESDLYAARCTSCVPTQGALGHWASVGYPTAQAVTEKYCIDLRIRLWARTVSNRRPLVCKTRALPLSYAPYARRAGYTPRGQDPKPSGR